MVLLYIYFYSHILLYILYVNAHKTFGPHLLMFCVGIVHPSWVTHFITTTSVDICPEGKI